MAGFIEPRGPEAAERAGLITKGSLASQAVSTTGLAQLAADLTTGTAVVPFGPGVPIAPTQPESEEPRRWDYATGFNIPMAPRTYEPITFALLRQLATNYDVAQLAIQKRIDGLRHLAWSVRPKPVAGMTRDEVRKRAARLEDDVAAATGFLSTPDQEHEFSDWLARWLYDVFTIDAGTLFLRPTLGGELFGLEVIDGATIRPIIDEYGRPPAPPMPAYGQVIKGSTREMLTRDQLVYAPYWGRTGSPYGHPPMEWVLLAVNRALRRQTLDLSNFSEGTMPAAFYRVAPDLPASQLRDLQEFLDELLAGNDAARSRVRLMPGGTGTGLDRVHPEPTTEGEQWLMHLTCAAYGVSPMELGFTPKGSGLGGTGMAETQSTAGHERNIGLALHLGGKIDRILAADPPYGLGLPELGFFWDDLDQKEDRLAEAQALNIYWGMGATSSDWIAENVLDQDPPGLGPVIAVGNTVVPIAEFLAPPEPVPAALAPFAGQPPDKGGPPPETPNAAPGEATNDEAVAEPARKVADLARWQRKALRAVRDGRDPTRFTSEALDPGTVALLRDALTEVATVDDVRAAFDLVKAGASASPFGPPNAAGSSGRSVPSSPRSSADRVAAWYARWD